MQWQSNASEQRTCSECGETKSSDAFYFRKSLNRFNARCKACVLRYSHMRRLRNAESLKAADKRRRMGPARERILAAQRLRHAANRLAANRYRMERYRANPPSEEQRTQRRQRSTAWYLANKERASVVGHLYYLSHSTEALEKWRKRHILKLGNGGSFSTEQFRDLCDQYGHRCLRCGKDVPLTVDHVIPLSLGGSNDISNIQPLCDFCNKSKGASWADYRKRDRNDKEDD